MTGIVVIAIMMSAVSAADGSVNIFRALAPSSVAAASPNANAVYHTVDGQALSVAIYRPSGPARPWPTLFYIHGGGWNTGGNDTAKTATEPKTPKAFPRSRGSVKVLTRAPWAAPALMPAIAGGGTAGSVTPAATPHRWPEPGCPWSICYPAWAWCACPDAAPAHARSLEEDVVSAVRAHFVRRESS